MAEKDVVKYITNPLNAFLLIKRSTSDIKLITDRFPSKTKEFFVNVYKLLPSSEDLFGAVEGLIRLQVIYRLKSVDFANGIIDGTKLRSELTPHDLFVIGQEAFKIDNRDYFVKEYLNMALEKIKKGKDPDKEVNVDLLYSTLGKSYNRTGDYVKAIAMTEQLIKKYPNNQNYTKIKFDLMKRQEKFGKTKLWEVDPFSDYIKRDGSFQSYKELILFSQVCRGNVTKSPKELAALKCRYVFNTPGSKIGPFKIEEANLDPYLVLFIDVLSDSEAAFLKEISKPKVKRGRTFQNSKDLEYKVSSGRVAKLAAHSDQRHDIIKRISQRVEVSFLSLHNQLDGNLFLMLQDMTGLTQKTSEMIQVQNYGIGGHYVPHWDHRNTAKESNFDKDGNRIATALFYVNMLQIA